MRLWLCEVSRISLRAINGAHKEQSKLSSKVRMASIAAFCLKTFKIPGKQLGTLETCKGPGKQLGTVKTFKIPGKQSGTLKTCNGPGKQLGLSLIHISEPTRR